MADAHLVYPYATSHPEPRACAPGFLLHPMKTPLLSAVLFLLTVGVAAAAVPDVTPEGLTLVKGAKADVVYLRPGVSFTGYTKLMLIEPTIAFKKDWQKDTQLDNARGRVSDAEMAGMIAMGKRILIEEFARTLMAAGYTFVQTTGPDVLAIRPAIQELDIPAPDPSNQIGSYNKVYTEQSGEATLAIELYDSVTGQLLARAYDRTSGDNAAFNRPKERTHDTNVQDAHLAMREWAKMLAKGLERAKSTKVP